MSDLLFESRLVSAEVLDVALTELVCKYAQSFFQVILEAAFQFAAVVIIKTAVAFSLACFPATLIDGLQIFNLIFALKPKVCSSAFRQIVVPISLVPLKTGIPIYHTSSLLLIHKPLTFILISRNVFHFACSLPETFIEFAFIDCSIRKSQYTFSLLEPVFPRSLIA